MIFRRCIHAFLQGSIFGLWFMSIQAFVRNRHYNPPQHTYPCTYNCQSGPLSMVRNIDLPECLIFYGRNTVFSSKEEYHSGAIKSGLDNLLRQAEEVGTVCILLSESKSVPDLQEIIDHSSISKYVRAQSSLDMGDAISFGSPSPLGLLGAIDTVTISPRGFGGSSGFGRKTPDPDRPPLPKHCVVFVSGEKGQEKCIAARVAGMRVLYVEIFGECNSDDLADGVINNYEELAYIDDIATPGSFWLNPPTCRDESGYRVDPYVYAEQIKKSYGDKNSDAITHEFNSSDMDEDEIARILDDLDIL